MEIKGDVLLTILGMALVTYLTRVGGFWLMSRFQLSKRVEAWLRQIPGAVLVSLIAPGLVTSGFAPLPGAIVTVAVARLTGNLLAAMVAGIATVWAVRTFLGLP